MVGVQPVGFCGGGTWVLFWVEGLVVILEVEEEEVFWGGFCSGVEEREG